MSDRQQCSRCQAPKGLKVSQKLVVKREDGRLVNWIKIVNKCSACGFYAEEEYRNE